MVRSSLLKYIETGQIRFDEGSIVFFGYKMIFVPARTLVVIHNLSVKSFGDKGRNLFYKGGYEHIKHIFETFSQKFDLSQMDSETFINLFSPTGQTLGFGRIEFKTLNTKTGEIIVHSKNNPFAQLYKELYGKQNKGVDDFVRGMTSSLSDAFSQKKTSCIETHCIAKGDPYCEFIANPEK